MTALVNRQLVLVTRPEGAVEPAHFMQRERSVPELKAGEALVRVHWLGIDATQRTWLNPDAAYTSPAQTGAVMPGSGVGQVVRSRAAHLAAGDWVAGPAGWQDYAIASSEGLQGFNKVPDGIDPKLMLSLFGVNGLTAYFGLTEVGRVAEADTVLVTGAAGGVGSLAVQMARLSGCRVIGSAGGGEKCVWLREVAGVDVAIDYKNSDMAASLEEAAPGGVNVVFDNVGGPALEAALDCIALHARVVLCGSISSGYRNQAYGTAPRNYMELAFKRARMEGFIFFDYADRFPKAFGDIAGWLRAGEIEVPETVSVGLETAPAALAGLFTGNNLGKQLVRVVD